MKKLKAAFGRGITVKKNDMEGCLIDDSWMSFDLSVPDYKTLRGYEAPVRHTKKFK